jgi:hypothetical protein
MHLSETSRERERERKLTSEGIKNARFVRYVFNTHEGENIVVMSGREELYMVSGRDA